MISKNIKDYVKVYDNFVDLALCDQTVASLQNAEWQTHKFYDSFKSQYVTHEKELSVSFNDIPESLAVKQRLWFAIEQYIVKDFSSFKPWFSGWEGFTHLKFNKYDVDTQMSIHCDHIKSAFDGQRRGIPILSVILSLNDNYKGGEFVMWQDEVIPINKGSVIIFPSNFMYPHNITAVTEGTRYSCVSWVW